MYAEPVTLESNNCRCVGGVCDSGLAPVYSPLGAVRVGYVARIFFRELWEGLPDANTYIRGEGVWEGASPDTLESVVFGILVSNSWGVYHDGDGNHSHASHGTET